jgi:hypothetical protein
MPDLYGNTDDGRCSISAQSSWANARDHNGSGGGVTLTAASLGGFTNVSKSATRGGGTAYGIARSFMYFDTSGITGTVATATIKIHGYTGNDGSIIAVKSTAFGGDGGTALASTDLDNISGFSAGSSLDGNATVYAPQILTTNWSTSGYNDMTGTSDLKADMQNNNVVIICFMDYTNDYLNVEPSSNVTLNVGGKYTEAGGSGTSEDPYIEYTLGGYANNVNGVASASIGKVKGVATASIDKIIGV